MKFLSFFKPRKRKQYKPFKMATLLKMRDELEAKAEFLHQVWVEYPHSVLRSITWRNYSELRMKVFRLERLIGALQSIE